MKLLMDLKGFCPNCELDGEVGHSCSERVCERRSYHFIPQQHFKDVIEKQGTHIDPFIGKMIDDYLVVNTIGAVEQGLSAMGYTFEPGAGVAAAQGMLLDRT